MATRVQRQAEREKWILFGVGIPLYIGWVWIGDGFVAWLVEQGGYGLSNAVLGALAVVLGLLAVRYTRRAHRRLETDPEPETLDAPRSYTRGAKRLRLFTWLTGAGAWALAAVLVVRGDYAAVAFWPILGITAVLLGRLEVRHARAMDARRGQPPREVR